MTPEQAGQWLRFFQRRFAVLPDREELLMNWHTLVTTLKIKGFRSHEPVGLLLATTSKGDYGFIAPIKTVLDQLRLSLVSGHGL